MATQAAAAESVETPEEPEDRGDKLPSTEEVKAEQTEEVKAEAKSESVEDNKDAEGDAESEDPTAIPYSRFKAQNLKLRETQEQLKKLQEQLDKTQQAEAKQPESKEPAQARDFDAELEAAEAKLAAALKDGDTDAVLAANREIRAIDKAQYQQQLDEVRERQNQTQDTIAQEAFDETLSMIESEFPELDPTGNQANTAKIQVVQELLSAYESQGMASDDALLRAVALTYPDSEFGRELLGLPPAEKAAEPAPAPAAKEPRGLSQKLAAAQQTPPNLARAGGENSDKAGLQSEIDVTKLTDEELAALPPETMKRLRGDTLVA